MSQVVGIDLGTTNSVVSIWRRGHVETIPVSGRATMPSVVAYKQDGSVLAGVEAKSRALLDPGNTVVSVKRHMGDREQRFEVARQVKTPVEVSSDILAALKQAAEAYLKEPVTHAVITVPAYFTDAQREDTRQAGQLAGFTVERLLPEPTAAAIAYGFNRNRDQKLLVYDLGGGTFDVSILHIHGDNYDVEGLDGDAHLGGDDFDDKIIGWILRKFYEATGVRVDQDPSTDALLAMQKLKEVAERAKIELSVANSTEIEIPSLLGKPFFTELTRAEYNTLISPLVLKTVEIVNRALSRAKITAEDIDRVILVGGSTKNWLVHQTVRERLKEPYIADHVDEAVSHGAAIMAAWLSNVEEVTKGSVTERTAHTLGIDLDDSDVGRIVFKPIIKQQTVYPCRSGFLGAARAGQRQVRVTVYRGDDPDPKRNDLLGALEMDVTFVGSRQVSVLCVFELDTDGIIVFTAMEFSPDFDIGRIMSHCDRDGWLPDASIVDTIHPSSYRSKTIEVRAN